MKQTDLRLFLKKKGYSATQFALLSRMQLSTVTRFLNGKTKRPQAATLVKMFKFVNGKPAK